METGLRRWTRRFRGALRPRGRSRRDPGQLEFAHFVQSVTDYAIFGLDPQGNVLTWNKGARRIKGYSRDEIVGRHFSVFYPPEEIALGKPGRLLREAAERGSVEDEGWRVRKDGSRFWASVVITAVREDGALVGFTKVVRDLTERREAKAMEKRLSQIADVVPNLVWVTDADGNVNYVNARWTEFTGQALAESKGRGWQAVIHPDDLPRALEFWGRARQRAERFEMDLRLRAADGSYRWFLCRGVPVRDPEGWVAAYFGTNVDIHEKITSAGVLEEAVRERTGRLRETVAQLESFSYTASHDLRAPLRTIEGYAQLLLRDAAGRLDAVNRHRLERIASGVRRMDALIHDLLVYAAIGRAEIKTEPLSLDELASELVEHYGGPSEIAVEKPLGRVLGQRSMVLQSLGNLLDNARKFARTGEKPRVKVWTETKDGVLRLWVEDHGIGLDPAQMPKLFQPFERGAGRQYPGTGIGLAIVKRSIERLGGSVGAASAPEGGSRFWIELPKA